MKKNWIIILMVMLLSLNTYAQEKSAIGVNFFHHYNWEQITKKAKSEGKFIFIDSYATWCGPCKMMDRDVYTNDTISNFTNRYFISIKIQMDSTAKDNDEVRSGYQLAKEINKYYHITGYPCFLFFNPDGAIVHRSEGYQKPSAFLSTLKNAIDPDHQYYTLIDRYKSGRKDYKSMPELIDNEINWGSKSISEEIANDYILNYLYRLDR